MMSRKEFIGKFWGLALLPYLLFSVLMARKHARVSSQTVLTIDGNIPEGISFHEGVIGIREGDRLTFFSDRCTHLGCKINHADGGLLVCPCHGSAYSADGAVHRGPASRGLAALSHSIDPISGSITVSLKP